MTSQDSEWVPDRSGSANTNMVQVKLFPLSCAQLTLDGRTSCPECLVLIGDGICRNCGAAFKAGMKGDVA